MDKMDKKIEKFDVKSKSRLQSILVKPGLVEDDDSFFKGPMRPRAMTDPISPRPCHHVRFDLPDIIVDDCSDDENNTDDAFPDEKTRELANTDEGAFFVYTSPPRQRANTCPVNMFSSKTRVRKHRPPTPPPTDRVSPDFPRYPSWEKADFSRHQLDCVEEVKESVPDSNRSDSPRRSRKALHANSKTTKTSSTKETKDSSNSSSSSVPKLTNGHVSSKSSGIIQTSA